MLLALFKGGTSLAPERNEDIDTTGEDVKIILSRASILAKHLLEAYANGRFDGLKPSSVSIPFGDTTLSWTL